MFNVIIVDDDQIVLEGLNRFVDWRELGFKVIGTAASVNEAIKLIETEYIDVILTDIVMPSRGGFELIKEALVINPYIKTVVLSSHIDFNYAKEAMRLGSFDYLTKPVNFEELKGIFNKLKAILNKELTVRKRQVQIQIEHLKETTIDFIDFKEKPIGLVIESVMKYINEHYNEAITLQKLSEIAYVHPIYLSKLFKEKTGENFIDYLTKVRIDHSKRLLWDLSLRIYDVCEMVGYDSPKHFSKVFKEITGVTPKDYRGKYHSV